jgi:amino acid transporter, AAT family
VPAGVDSALLAQLALRLSADREGAAHPLLMPGFLWLTGLGLLLLAAIFTVGLVGEDSRPQRLSARGGFGGNELGESPVWEGCARR